MRYSGLPRVVSVEPLHRFVLRLTFTDGFVGDIDLEPDLRGEVFEPLKADETLFRQVIVDQELGTIVWPNGADMCPDGLREDAVSVGRGQFAPSR